MKKALQAVLDAPTLQVGLHGESKRQVYCPLGSVRRSMRKRCPVSKLI